MSYYAVDLFSMPSGARGGPAPAVGAPSGEAPAIVKEEPAPQEVIRLPGKVKKKPPILLKPKTSGSSKTALPSWAETFEGGGGSGGDSDGGGMPGAAGAGIVADAGPAFPYPWYLKAIADRLDKQWHPPREFQADTACQVTFVISRGGEISGAQISKPSGDSIFDQVALRAVLYANPLPPLPAGFPDETLKVHMKFVGRRL